MADPITSYWQLLEPEFATIDIYSGPEIFAEVCRTIWKPIVLLYATHMCASELHNGGFLQLFWNNTGIAVPEAIEGYKTIGMPNLAELVDSAALLLGDPYPRDRDDRWDALLIASGRSSRELGRLFDAKDNLYLSFEEATAPLDFNSLNQKFWGLVAEENGGYNAAATRYARSISQVQ
jgi:hypothetical protein